MSNITWDSLTPGMQATLKAACERGSVFPHIHRKLADDNPLDRARPWKSIEGLIKRRLLYASYTAKRVDGSYEPSDLGRQVYAASTAAATPTARGEGDGTP